LTKYQVAVCTASMYGYALRKMVEATACGCVVVTDLPVDEVLPGIDGNLVRIEPDYSAKQVGSLLRRLYGAYDPEKQAFFAAVARDMYDYRVMGKKLAADIETMRGGYGK
jgi:hypothetical protein